MLGDIIISMDKVNEQSENTDTAGSVSWVFSGSGICFIYLAMTIWSLRKLRLWKSSRGNILKLVHLNR